MAPKCCMPGCKSNYRPAKGDLFEYVSIFQFPTDPELKEKWQKCIPRKNWTPDKTTVVCAKHFLLSDIIVSDKYTDKSGVVHELPRKRPALKKDACPVVFSEGLAASYRPRSKKVSLSRLSTSTIVKNEEAIVIKSANIAKWVKSISKQRSETLEHVEQLLLMWITEKHCAGDRVSQAMIRIKAKLIHADLLKNKAGANQEESQVFKANHAWFVNFKKTYIDIHNVARPGEGASADEDAVDDFVTEAEGFETDLTLKRMPNRACIKQEVKQEKTEYDTDGEVHTLEDISLASDLNKIDNYVSSHSPSHNSHTCVDVEENRTAENNSHGSVCVRENVLSERTSNHQVITSENIKEEMCYTEDVRSGEDKNKQTQKEATESVIAVDFQAMMDGVKDGHNENRKDLQQGNKLWEQGLSACKKKTPKCQQADANIVMCSRKYLDEIFLNKWKTKSAASQKSSHPPVLQSVQPTSILHYDQPSVLHSDQPSVLQSVQPSVLLSVQPSVLQSDQPSVLQFDQPSVLQSDQPSVLQSDQPSVVQSYKCKFCHHGFLLNSSLTEHRLVQRGILPHICSNCGLAFRLDTVLMKHTNEQIERKEDESAQFDDTFYKRDFSDGICQQNIFPRKHKLIHTKEKPYQCDVCGRRFATNSLLKMHTRTHSGVKPYKCDVCDRGFTAYSILNMHKIAHSGLKPYKCGVCDRGFARKGDMKRHTRTHTGEKPYLCEVCGRGFAKKYGLKRHTRTHTGEKPYKCDVCNHVFVLKGALDVHKETHTGKQTHTSEKLYQCDTCGLTFAQRSGLMQHTRTHIVGKPFKCDVCCCGYRSKNSFTIHKKTHRGEIPEGECDICGKTLMHKSYLKIHKRVHTQERPYKCNVCRATYKQSSSLYTHKLTHAGETPYKCDICGFQANRKYRLRLHKRIHKA